MKLLLKQPEEFPFPRTHKYLNQLEEVANGRHTTIQIELDDLKAFEEDGSDDISGLVESIETNSYRYVDLFSQAIDSIIPESTINSELSQMDAVSVIASHRQARMTAKGIDTKSAGPLQVPAALMRRYSVTFKARSKVASVAVRQIHADAVGHMIRLRGIITRVTEVKTITPSRYLYMWTMWLWNLSRSQFHCLYASDWMSLGGMQSKRSSWSTFPSKPRFPIPQIPRSPNSRIDGSSPNGPHSPFTTVNLYGDLCRTCNPGDHVIIDGIYMPVRIPDSRPSRPVSSLTLTCLPTPIEQLKIKSRVSDQGIIDDIEEFQALAADPQMYDRLAKSLAPWNLRSRGCQEGPALIDGWGVNRTLRMEWRFVVMWTFVWWVTPV